MSDWMVMASVDPMKNNGTSFPRNATQLTEAEAIAEADRRNQVEKAEGHRGVSWFPARDPMSMLKSMGFNLTMF
jgi:hypothetical protein